MIKNNKGITMVTLIITIVIILIISGVTIYQSVEDIKVREIDSLYTDLELLEDKVNTYYLTYGTIPIKEEFKGSENFKTVRNVNDNNVYYVIDISLLDGVSLNMKLDFTGDDVYIMNEQSHTVYYPKGLTIDNETYYTLPKQYSKIMTNEPSVDENETGGSTGEDTPIEPTLPSVDENGLATEDTTITTDESNVQIVIPKGFAPVILQTDRTDSMPGENGAVKAIMPASDWNSITADQINKGIVVVDHAITYDGGQPTGTEPDFNEYVWIPMPDSSKFARIAWTTPSLGEQVLSDESVEDGFWEDKTTQEYREMVNSVNTNKGFYISRYEASQKDSTTAQSKRGQYPWVGISQSDAKTASSNMKTSINSHLIYGIEWDSILQWFLDSSAIIWATDKIDTINIRYIEQNSTSFGNYERRIIPGGREDLKVNNIYDLAGNIEEITQEITQESISMGLKINRQVSRGGNCLNGIRSPIAERAATIPMDYIGFRVSFYV